MKFELVMYERDRKGNVTRRVISCQSDNAYEIWEFFNKNSTKGSSDKKTSEK